ncbi:hypothetical protein AMK07_CH02782 [Rhizobium sp. N941]|nr:hypothetical protein AMK07_CH02782 [Rhizobium sp. N941]
MSNAHGRIHCRGDAGVEASAGHLRMRAEGGRTHRMGQVSCSPLQPLSNRTVYIDRRKPEAAVSSRPACAFSRHSGVNAISLNISTGGNRTQSAASKFTENCIRFSFAQSIAALDFAFGTFAAMVQ